MAFSMPRAGKVLGHYIPHLCAAGAALGLVSHHNSRSLAMGTRRQVEGKQTCVIVGAGVVGLTTAYCLRRMSDRYDIHIIDQQPECSLGASFQNGGVINVEAVSPITSYLKLSAVMKGTMLHALLGSPTNTLITWRALREPGWLWWLYFFLTRRSHDDILMTSKSMKKIGDMTKNLFEDASTHLKLSTTGHNFSHTPGLILWHSKSPNADIEAKRTKFDAVHRKKYITDDQLLAVQKSCGLQHLDGEGFTAGCVEPHNFTVNTRTFCKQLEQYLLAHGVRITYEQQVERICTGDGQVNGIVLANGDQVKADSVVLAAGFETAYLLRDVGISAPISAVKAYSLHVRGIDTAKHLRYATLVEGTPACLITPYKDEDPPAVRVTGIRDMDGCNDIIREDRIASLAARARKLIGDFSWQDAAVWAGVMAVSPDDLPLVGPTSRYPNLFLNTGHGFRGTNFSLASATLLVDAMEGSKAVSEELALAVSPSRFGI